jgi:hypothetical protein
MADKYDPYREALVMEIETEWPESCRDLSAAQRRELEARVHAAASDATELHYIRTHTGFCRKIVVHQADLDRLEATAT